MAEKKIALFIDADNISAKFGKQIIDALESRGEIFIRRIYGNWEKNFLHSWNDCILNFSLRAVQQPDFVTGKNATDMCLTIDAMDVLHAGKAEIFALVSNDSDFTPLVIRLREGGMTIIGIGNSHASNAFRAACNEFIDLDATLKDTGAEVKEQPSEKKISRAPEKNSSVQMSLFDTENPVAQTSELPPKKSSSSKVVPITVQNHDAQDKLQVLHDLLQEAAQLHADAEGFTAMCWAGQNISNQKLGFSVKDFGYGSLHKFVSDFPDLYEVIQRDNGENFCYRCLTVTPKNFPVAVDKPPTSDNNANLQQMHDVLREAVTVCANDDGFANLCSVGSYVNKKNLGFGVKNLGFGTMQKFLDSFPNLYEVRKEEHKVFLRCRVEKMRTVPVDDKIDSLHDILRQTAKARADESGFTDLSYVGNSLGKQKIGFGIRDLGYGTLQKFVADFPERYELRKTLKKIFYRCRDVKSDSSTNDNKLRQLHNILRESASLHADADGFSPINHAGQEIKSKHLNFGIRNFGYGQLREFVADFPDLYEISHDKCGRKFRYRCKRA